MLKMWSYRFALKRGNGCWMSMFVALTRTIFILEEVRPMIPSFDMTHHEVTLGLLRNTGLCSFRRFIPQTITSCLLKAPLNGKLNSSREEIIDIHSAYPSGCVQK